MDSFETLTNLHTVLTKKMNNHACSMRMDDDDLYTVGDMLQDLVKTCFCLHKKNENYDIYLKYALLLYADLD